MKNIFVIVLFIFLPLSVFSQSVNNITIEVSNIIKNGGKVYLYLFSNAEEFKKRSSHFAFIFDDTNEILSKTIAIPHGEYMIWLYQDSNNNDNYDTNFFGIPKEPFGYSNYYGSGLPSNDFDKHKILVNNITEKIAVTLVNHNNYKSGK
jgi:uncharacterized protein (DUF2141 family)